MMIGITHLLRKRNDMLQNDAFVKLLFGGYSPKDQSVERYPPTNILKNKRKENSFIIELAVAGFKRDELDVVTENDVLTVSGNKQGEAVQADLYLHKGIAVRHFTRKIALGPNYKVTTADLADGILTIYIEETKLVTKKQFKIN